MLRRLLLASVVVALALGLATQVSAAPILSRVGVPFTSTLAGVPAAGTTVAITAHPLWQQNGPNGTNAIWVSYDQTGYTSNTSTPSPTPYVLAPYAQGKTAPVMTVLETFYADLGWSLSLNAWADDTAIVKIDNVIVFDHTHWQQSICEVDPISCGVGNFGHIDFTFTTAGIHTLAFDTYQIGTGNNNYLNPFGLLYEGELVPEPGSMLLLGTGLLGLAGAVRRRFRR